MDLSLIIIARYSNGTDIIDQVTTPVNDRVIMTTYKNIASQKSWGLNFDLNNYFLILKMGREAEILMFEKMEGEVHTQIVQYVMARVL